MQNLLIGLIVGIAVGFVALYILHGNHKRTVAKLVDSRSKLERQRTQAVNDLFALRSQVEYDKISGVYPAVVIEKSDDPNVTEEINFLRDLVMQAESALKVLKKKNSAYKKEIATLKDQLGRQDAQVINLHEDRSAVNG